jgi:hypothetical protein
VVENIHCPSPQPEDYARNEDPGFCEDPDIYIEFDDGVFYQASLDGSEVAITADYPRLYPFSIVSIQKASSKRSPYLRLIHYTKLYFIGSALGKPHSLESGLYAGRSFKTKGNRERYRAPSFKEVCPLIYA